jgi:hypothetical protein
MADAYQIETTADRYLLEDGSGVYLLEGAAAGPAAISAANIQLSGVTVFGIGQNKEM